MQPAKVVKLILDAVVWRRPGPLVNEGRLRYVAAVITGAVVTVGRVIDGLVEKRRVVDFG